jgi:hypothetical protein
MLVDDAQVPHIEMLLSFFGENVRPVVYHCSYLNKICDAIHRVALFELKKFMYISLGFRGRDI